MFQVLEWLRNLQTHPLVGGIIGIVHTVLLIGSFVLLSAT